MVRPRHALLLTLPLLAACSTIREVEIRTNPPRAAIKVDGKDIGLSPRLYDFDFADEDAVYKVEVSKEGYVTGTKKVSILYLEAMKERREDLGEKEQGDFIVIKIDEDESWTKTGPSPAANKWLQLSANPQMDQSQVWEILVDIVTKYYPDLTNLDNKAGYIAAREKKKRFKRGPTATVWVRNQFFCSIASRSPLVYKVKIQSQINEDGSWKNFDRVFKTDTKLITDLQAKLVAQ